MLSKKSFRWILLAALGCGAFSAAAQMREPSHAEPKMNLNMGIRYGARSRGKYIWYGPA